MKKIKGFKVNHYEGDLAYEVQEVYGYCLKRVDALVLSIVGHPGSWGKGAITEVSIEYLESENRYFYNGNEVTNEVMGDDEELHIKMRAKIAQSLTEEELEYLQLMAAQKKEV